MLVVGSGQSGCQITEELNSAGRRVFRSVGRAGREPRRYRGRDINYWIARMGGFDRRVRNPADPVERYTPNPHCSGKAGGRALNPWKLAHEGVTLTGRAVGLDGSVIAFAPDLLENLAHADRSSRKLMKDIDDCIAAKGLRLPEPDEDNTDDGDSEYEPALEPFERLDLQQSGITTIVEATGFDRDYSWINLPVLDQQGYPLQDRGVSPFPGLYFCGLHWMYSLGSGSLFGVGEAAAHVTGHLLEKYDEQLGAFRHFDGRPSRQAT